MTKIIHEDLGVVPYAEAWKYQLRLFDENVKAKLAGNPTRNTLLLCEHPPVITVGKNGKEQNLLFSEAFLRGKNIELFHIDRGGDVTYHGPGQIVAYPIFDLETFGIGLRQYVGLMEEIMIKLLAPYGVKASRNEKAPGVWLDTNHPATMRKIGAIGVRSSRYITMHGFALNITTDLSCFSFINPCGFTDKGVTSLLNETGAEVSMDEVKSNIRRLFEEEFGASF